LRTINSCYECKVLLGNSFSFMTVKNEDKEHLYTFCKECIDKRLKESAKEYLESVIEDLGT
jgi:hypothetical protein